MGVKILGVDLIMWRRRFTTAFLLAAWLLTPDLLCLIPGVEMTAAEHECCERMGSDCGKIPMPDVHSCCRTETPTDGVLIARITNYAEQRSLTAPAIIPDLDLLRNIPELAGWRRFTSPTPPPLVFQESFDVLRI
jgi:hypothetical protein